MVNCIIKLACLLVAFLSITSPSFAGQVEKNYAEYHKRIINAENEIFLNNDSIQGLQILKKTFEDYEFAYVDDCIEAFQLALFFKREDYAMSFIKKALENGFELKFLDALSLGCPCDFYTDIKARVIIHEPFMRKNRKYLEAYAKACYPKYLQRIDKDLLVALLKRHMKEQLFKNCHAGLCATMEEQEKRYVEITEDNLRFMDSLAARKIFLGERNLGIYTNKLAENLNLPFRSIENYLADLLKLYGLPQGTYVPIAREDHYYEEGAIYIMLFHNPKSYASLYDYKDEAIEEGYLHPREYAYLRNNHKKMPEDFELYLGPTNKKLADTRELNERRKRLLLPTFEMDFSKHAFAHKSHLQLFFRVF